MRTVEFFLNESRGPRRSECDLLKLPYVSRQRARMQAGGCLGRLLLGLRDGGRLEEWRWCKVVGLGCHVKAASRTC